MMKVLSNEDILITDPCYIARKGDWGKKFDFYTNTINVPQIKNYLWDSTGFGDGVWDVFEIEDSKKTSGSLIRNYLRTLDNLDDSYDEDDEPVILEDVEKLHNKIGTGTADSGCVGVYLLSEVLDYNPDFPCGLCNNCFSIISDFTGTIEIIKTNEYFHVLGIGNKIFYTI